mgnify:FL=1
MKSEEVSQLEPNDVDWETVRITLDEIMGREGTVLLKPIFEGANEQFDYNLIRLARIQYRLEGKEILKEEMVF